MGDDEDFLCQVGEVALGDACAREGACDEAVMRTYEVAHVDGRWRVVSHDATDTADLVLFSVRWHWLLQHGASISDPPGSSVSVGLCSLSMARVSVFFQ